MVAKAKISAVIITLNEEENIEKCLLALKEVVAEIIVVDAFSEDETVELCERFGAKIIQRKWEGYSVNKNYGHSVCKNDWILSIDADEVLSEDLIENLQNLNLKENEVYALNRLTNYAGKWVRHCWHPEWKVRLFNRNWVNWRGDFVHETLAIPESFKTIKLKGLLYHYSFKSVEDHFHRIEKYANLAATELFKKRKKATFFRLWISPIARFFKTYFLKKGFLDGKLGWQISCREAYSVHLKYHQLKKLYNPSN